MKQTAETRAWIPSEETLKIIEKIKLELLKDEERLKTSTIQCKYPGCEETAAYSHSEGSYQIVVRMFACPKGHMTSIR